MVDFPKEQLLTNDEGPGCTEDITAMLAKQTLYDDYWESKCIPVEKIETPMYIAASFSCVCSSIPLGRQRADTSTRSMLHTRGSFHTFRVARTTQKWLRVHPYFECTSDCNTIFVKLSSDDAI